MTTHQWEQTHRLDYELKKALHSLRMGKLWSVLQEQGKNCLCYNKTYHTRQHWFNLVSTTPWIYYITGHEHMTASSHGPDLMADLTMGVQQFMQAWDSKHWLGSYQVKYRPCQHVMIFNTKLELLEAHHLIHCWLQFHYGLICDAGATTDMYQTNDVSCRELVTHDNGSLFFHCAQTYLMHCHQLRMRQCWKFPQVCWSEADNSGGETGSFCWFFFNFMFMIWDSWGPTTDFQSLGRDIA